MNRILVEKTGHTVCVAGTVGGVLCQYDCFDPDHQPLSGCIYLGRIAQINKTVQAAFVELGQEKRGFLPLRHAGDLQQGQLLPVQVTREPLADKGARLTAFPSLPGLYTALTWKDPHIRVSHRIEDAAEQERLKEILAPLAQPDVGWIARTAAQGRDPAHILQDAQEILALWQHIARKAAYETQPMLLYTPHDPVQFIVQQALRMQADAVEIQDPDVYTAVLSLAEIIAPHIVEKIQLYAARPLLFDARNVWHAIAALSHPKVWLPCGGWIFIEHTEAMWVIDVNSGKYTSRSGKGAALTVNLQAAKEVARQLRLRGMGGMICIDFIGMDTAEERETLLSCMRSLAADDPVGFSVQGLTALGIVELTRRHTHTGISAQKQHLCPMCHGTGSVPDASTVALQLYREILKQGPERPLRLQAGQVLYAFLQQDGILAACSQVTLEQSPALWPTAYRLETT